MNMAKESMFLWRKSRWGVLIVTLILGTSWGFAQEKKESGEAPSEFPVKTPFLREVTLPLNTAQWDHKSVNGLGVPCPVDHSQTESLHYWVFYPENLSEKNERGLPLFFLLHGAGERGSDQLVLDVINRYITPEVRDSWPFLTIMPCCPDGKYWSPEQLSLFLDEMEKIYPIDPQRIYVSGGSMGGYGTWMMMLADGDRFAAAAPVCGGVDPENAKKLVDYPIWIFHGAIDPVVPVAYSIDAEAAIREAGGQKIKLTVYPNVEHGAGDVCYLDPELYKWFLSHVNPHVKTSKPASEK